MQTRFSFFRTALFFMAAQLVFSFNLGAQNYRLTWGEEMKFKKGTADLELLMTDNSGLFLTESRVRMKSYFVIGATYGTAVKLMKLDKNFGEVYDKEYKKELRGLDFHSFQPLEGELYLFATDYDKKLREYVVLAAKVDRSNGDLAGDFIEVGRYAQESKRDDFEMKITAAENGKTFLLVSNISGKDRVSIGVSLLERNFKKKLATTINLNFDPAYYSLEDVKYTSTNKIVLLGKESEETQWGKKKKKRIVFKQYNMAVFNMQGKKENDVKMDVENRFVIGGKLVEGTAGQMLLAGFYSNSSKKEDLNGFFINKLDIQKGELVLSSYKEINADMLGQAVIDDNDDDEEIKENKKQAKKAKENDDEEEFPNSFIIKSVDINPADSSIVITSEVSQYTHYSYYQSSYNAATKTYTGRWVHVHRFTNKDILVINADRNGGIRWLNAMAKSQVEEIRTNSASGMGIGINFDYSGYFATRGGMPYYSSYKSFLNNGKLIFIFNDHTSNNVNPEFGTRVKTVVNFRKRSNVYGVAVDLATGKMTRKNISSNSEETILMPRHSLVVNNELFVPSWRQHMLAKTEFKIAKISVK
jgi:hypothetical protein